MQKQDCIEYKLGIINRLTFTKSKFARVLSQKVLKEQNMIVTLILISLGLVKENYQTNFYFKYSFKYLPVCEISFSAISSGVPTATIQPPPAPPSGPRSMT